MYKKDPRYIFIQGVLMNMERYSPSGKYVHTHRSLVGNLRMGLASERLDDDRLIRYEKLAVKCVVAMNTNTWPKYHTDFHEGL